MTPQHILREILFSRPWIRLGLIVLAFIAATTGLMAPLFQREFLNFFLQQSTTPSSLLSFGFSERPAFALAASIGVLFVSLVCSQLVTYLATREAFLMQRRLGQRLYETTLQLRTEGLQGRPVGEIVSVYATDIPGATILLEQSTPQGLNILFPLILTPILLIYEFHIPATVILISLIALLLLNFGLAYRQSIFFYLFKKLAADRIAVVNEWIQNLRTLRILGWTGAFEKKIFELRKNETENRIQMLNNGQTMNAISSSISYLLNTALVYYIVRHTQTPIDPAGLLTLLWVVAVFLTRPFRQLPWFFTFLFDGWTSIKRLADVMALQQTQSKTIQSVRPDGRKLNSMDFPRGRLLIQNLNFRKDGREIMKDISFQIEPGSFVAVVGEVGSGKTSLLLSLLRENSATTQVFKLGNLDMNELDEFELKKAFSFVPQDSFVMSATLKENVFLDYKVENQPDELALHALRSAQFDPNQEGLPDGLETEVGERGVNLSGGQRQRITLARVLTSSAPVILMDDALSAVDVETEAKLMKGFIKGALKDRTRILVTHRLSVLRETDAVLFMAGGRVAAFGSFDQLFSENTAFREFTATLEKTQLEKTHQEKTSHE